MKYKINDILAFNSQGTFTVAIVTRIVIIGQEDVIYSVTGMDCDLDVLEENVIKCLGNAREIKAEYEAGQDD